MCPPLDPLPSVDTSYTAGYVMWGLVGLAVLLFELWAVVSGHHTMTQAVQHGPRWMQWLIGGGLIGLFVHLFLWR